MINFIGYNSLNETEFAFSKVKNIINRNIVIILKIWDRRYIKKTVRSREM